MSVTSSELNFEIQSKVYNAGAGAGKTTTLIHEVLSVADRFYKTQGRWPRIVVTTFTRKATQELKERLLEKALSLNRPDLMEFVSSSSSLQISTIHGILSLFLRKFAHQLDIDPEFRMIDQDESREILRRCLHNQLSVVAFEAQELLEFWSLDSLLGLIEAFHKNVIRVPDLLPFSAEDFTHELNDKLNSLSLKLKNLIGEISKQIGSLEDGEPLQLKWVTFCQDLDSVKSKLDQSISNRSWANDRWSILDQLSNLSRPRTQRSGAASESKISESIVIASKDIVEELQELSEPQYDPMIWPRFLETFNHFEKVARTVSDEFKSAKVLGGLMDFSDLELMSLDRMRMVPHVLKSFSNEWDYWLVDEYQDTSPLQVELLSHLISDRPCFVVGDPQQSIYLFRGARREVFQDRETWITEKGGEVQRLEVNYRSEPRLLEFFNDFFAQLGDQFRPMKNRSSAKFDESESDVEDPVARFYEMDTEESELESVSRHIKRLVAKGSSLDEICVIARTNSQLLKVAQKLEYDLLPIHLQTAGGFFHRREVLDALSILQFLVNPLDDLNLIRLFRSPWYRIRDEILGRARLSPQIHLWEQICDEDYWKSFELQADDQKVLESVRRRCCEALGVASKSGLRKSFEEQLIQCGLIDFSAKVDSTGLYESNIWKLIFLLRDAERKPGFSFGQFVRDNVDRSRLSSESVESDAIPSTVPQRVNLMTVHASKGLQFRHVVIPFMNARPQLTSYLNWCFDETQKRWGIPLYYGTPVERINCLPVQREIAHLRGRELEEQSRLLYVAMTRARQSVALTSHGTPTKNSWREMTKSNWVSGEHRGVRSGFSYTYCVHVEDAKDFVLENSRIGFDVSVRSPFRNVQELTESVTASVTERTRTLSESLTREVGRSRSFATGSWRGMVTGNSVHRIFEILRYGGRNAVESVCATWVGEMSREILDGVDYLMSCPDVPYCDLLKSGFAEWGFSLNFGTQVVRGQIDLWGIHDDVVYIVDYKTGSFQNIEQTFLQLQFYSLAVREHIKLYPQIKEIKLVAVYPLVKKVVVREALSATEVEGLLFKSEGLRSTRRFPTEYESRYQNQHKELFPDLN